jgi:rhamnogalacturonyl hydrolase YesR
MMADHISILTGLLNAAEAKSYSGYSKFDALNSPVLKKLTFNSKWLRLFYTQLVKQSPFHIRPLLKINQSRNPKGIALFARAYLFLYESTSHPVWLEKAEQLLAWLLDNPSLGPNPGSRSETNLCWGYNFIWQNTIFLQDEFEPNAVVTVFVGEAMVHAYRVTGNPHYLDAARSVAEFIIKDLPVIHETDSERAIAYVLRKVDAVVLNNQILTGALLVKIYKHTQEKTLLDIAIRQFNYTVNRATEYHAWYYTHPKEKSPITHDNYHTGGILDGLIEFYEEIGDDRFMDIYWKGLEFYRQQLFEPEGAPRWMHNRTYPFDVHGSAQGIISFKKASRHDPKYIDQAETIARWSIDNLYRSDRNDFIYRKGRFLKWNYSLMRWCNAWMARSLGEMIVK